MVSEAEWSAEYEQRLRLAADRLVSEAGTASRGAPEHAPRSSILRRAVGRLHRMARRARPSEPTTPVASHPSKVLYAFPYYPDNRWQAIVYDRLQRDGWSICPIDDLTPAVVDSVSPGVLHVNWTAAVTQRTPELRESMAAVDGAIAGMERFRERGGRIVWTVHNVLPHELHHLAPELVLCRALARLADPVTVMNPDTPRLVEPWYSLAESPLEQLPHPSYLGWFADDVSRQEARDHFGLEDDELTFLFVGVLRPYKGLTELLDVFAEVRAKHPRSRLLIAGAPGPGFTSSDQETLEAADGSIVHIGRVPDADMQLWCRAADVMVLPYRAALNISVVSLAATFGLPVILRRNLAQSYLDDEPWIRCIDFAETEAADFMLEFARSVAATPSLKAAAAKYAVATRPDLISERFAGIVEQSGSSVLRPGATG